MLVRQAHGISQAKYFSLVEGKAFRKAVHAADPRLPGQQFGFRVVGWIKVKDFLDRDAQILGHHVNRQLVPFFQVAVGHIEGNSKDPGGE